MYYLNYLLLWLVAGVATYIWAVREERVPMAGLVSTASWGVVALVGGSTTIYHQDGSTSAVGTPVMQWVAAGLALLSLGAVVLWIFGQYPPTQNNTREVIR
jgi:hypothetical protein